MPGPRINVISSKANPRLSICDPHRAFFRAHGAQSSLRPVTEGLLSTVVAACGSVNYCRSGYTMLCA